MANNYQSNINNKLLKSFIKGFESSTVLMNTVSKQLVNDFDPSTGGAYGAVSMKRPPQYVPQRTPDGDLSSSNANPVRSGKVQGEVSPNGYITVYVENTQVEEALEADQLDELLRPISEDMVVELESELALYMAANASLRSGQSAQAINKWSDVANAGALFKEVGAPSGMKYAVINSFDEVTLADLQTQLGVNPEVNEAWAGAVVKERFAGFNQVLTSNNLPEYTTGNSTTGITVANTPASTYTAYKNTYRMSLDLTGLTATTGTLSKGQQLEITAAAGSIDLINLRNRKTVRKDGGSITFTVTVLEDVVADGAGNATVSVSGAAISETGVDGAFNTVTQPIAAGDTITVLDTADTAIRPALAYCEGFVGCGSVVLPKLHALDSSIINYKGTSIRVHRFSDGVGNTNRYRFDILPTFATFMPEWGQQMFGSV